MANTAFQNVHIQQKAAVDARQVVLEAYRLNVLAGKEQETYGQWIELTQVEYNALGAARREGVLYAIVA